MSGTEKVMEAIDPGSARVSPEVAGMGRKAPVGVPLSKRLVSEALSSALLLATVVGSGIMGDRLSGGNVAIALLANSLATGAGLIALILTFGPISGAHMNAAVTLAMAARRELAWRDVLPYILVQVVGGILGVWATHFIFELPVFMTSQHVRTGAPQLASEVIATFGLLGVIFGVARAKPAAVPYAVGGYITAAYWFTSSTSFANPVVTIARSLTNTFAGIRPVDAPGFIVAQLVGAALATSVFTWLLGPSHRSQCTEES